MFLHNNTIYRTFFYNACYLQKGEFLHKVRTNAKLRT